MKTVMRWVPPLAILFLISTGAFAADSTPAKYFLDGQLDKVLSISKYNFMSWDKVDNQSFILQTSPSEYYLIILSKASDHILMSERISIDTSDATVKPGYNKVIVSGQGYNEWNIINKIYRLKDADQVREIKNQLAD